MSRRGRDSPGHGGAPARRAEEEPLQLGAQAEPGPGAAHRSQLAGGSQETEFWWRGGPGRGRGRGWRDAGAGGMLGLVAGRGSSVWEGGVCQEGPYLVCAGIMLFGFSVEKINLCHLSAHVSSYLYDI